MLCCLLNTSYVFMELHQTATTGITLKFSEGTIAINPPKKGRAPTPDVILYTYPVPADGWYEDVTAAEEQTVFTGPGEYEKNKLYIRGIGTKTALQGKELQTTSWFVDADGIRTLVLGDVNDRNETQKAVSELGDIDTLISFFQSGSKEKRLDAIAVTAIGAALQAKRIIPLGDDQAVKKRVAKELGTTEEVAGKYVLKKKDLLENVTKAVLFV